MRWTSPSSYTVPTNEGVFSTQYAVRSTQYAVRKYVEKILAAANAWFRICLVFDFGME